MDKIRFLGNEEGSHSEMRGLDPRCRVQRPEKWSSLGSVANKYRITKDVDRRKSRPEAH